MLKSSVLCGVRDITKEYHLSLSSMDVVKGDLRINSTYTSDRVLSDGDGLTPVMSVVFLIAK
jgi:hypothetical protein